MTAHDSWVTLKEGSPYEESLYLFPNGLPVRDPFPMEIGRTPDKQSVPLYTIDMRRLNDGQFDAIVAAIANKYNALIDEIMESAIEMGGFGLRSDWVVGLNCGAEGMQRTKEIADFFEANPNPTPEAFKLFLDDQRRRWIDGNEQPPPFPSSIEEVDPRLRTPELEEAIAQRRVENN